MSLLLCAPPLRAAEPAVAPSILVLASYHAGLGWSDGQLAGLRETLQAALPAGQPVPELFVEYLDTKRVAPAPRHLEQVRALLDAKYAEQRFVAVVTQDDDALDFVLGERRAGGLFAGLPVVFSGVSSVRQEALARLPSLTGVFDDADLLANISLLRRLRPNLSRVVFVHDHSRTGDTQAELARSLQGNFPGLRFEFLSRLPVAEIEQRLAALDATSGVILLTFNLDGAGRVLTHEEASRLWGAASNVPVLVKEDVMNVPGVLGGIVISSRRQGDLAARLLLRVLAGEDAGQLPMSGGVTDAVFRYDQLQRFGIDESALPPGSTVLGRERSLRETHPREFALLASLVVALAGVLLLAFVIGRRVRRERRRIAASERSHRELINATSEGIFILRVGDGIVLDVNERGCEMCGFSRDDLIGMPIAVFGEGSPPYTEADALHWLERSSREGLQLFDWHVRRKDGSLFWAEIGLRPAEIDGERRLVAAVRDVTQRRLADAALRESEARYSLILRKVPVGIVHFGRDWIISFCNDRFVDIIGSSKGQLIGLDIQKLRDKSLLPACAEALAGRQSEYEGPYISTTGARPMHVHMRTAPMFDENDEVVGGVAIFEDISLRVAAEQALRQINEELERRVGERTAELQATNDELRHAMTRIAQSEKLASLGSLVAGVAHELNTPLGNARTVASALNDRVREFHCELASGNLRKSALGSFVEASADAAALIERNLCRAVDLLGNFKQVAVDQTSMRRRAFDLRQIIDEVLSTLQPKLRKHPCRIDVDVPAGIGLDSYPGPLEQVLTNFILNSLIHGFEGREGGVIAIAAEMRGDEVLLDYRDDGAGMDELAASRAFDPFYTTRLGQGGSGLGLYIVHNLVTGALGGSITLSTTHGQGVRFTLLLPCAAPSSALDGSADATAAMAVAQ